MRARGEKKHRVGIDVRVPGCVRADSLLGVPEAHPEDEAAAAEGEGHVRHLGGLGCLHRREMHRTQTIRECV